MVEDQQLLFIDFEFTMPEKNSYFKGFYPEIIEAGVVAVVSSEIRIQFSTFVTPLRFPILSKRCKAFLHIKQEQVDHGISFVELLKKLNELNKGFYSKIVTWGNMDMRVLRKNCEMAKAEFPFSGEELDLSMEYKRFFGDQNQTGLWKAVKEYGREGTGMHHRALDDALTTYKIFRLVEKDKSYLYNQKVTTIGDIVDMTKLLNKFA
ncbi:3'-5' exonuclease KapD [Bacillaceae bacterium Marseille-Q3522]|nr:3'-5' exonuclease KapD [Bacillaceae bacterium Marseille-Q3522]